MYSESIMNLDGYPSGRPVTLAMQPMNDAQRPRRWLHLLVAHFHAGHTALPSHMGLTPAGFAALQDESGYAEENAGPSLNEILVLRDQVMALRAEECAELQAWLSGYVRQDVADMAVIVAHASMGFRHLWEDLGLDSRAELRALMRDCFPELDQRNSQNMRWKKFFYRERCLAEGNMLCRSPSCQLCHEREQCFEPT